jgi:hypothetical protein
MKEEMRERIRRRVLAALSPFTEELKSGSESDRFQAIGIANGAIGEWYQDELGMKPPPAALAAARGEGKQ